MTMAPGRKPGLTRHPSEEAVAREAGRSRAGPDLSSNRARPDCGEATGDCCQVLASAGPAVRALKENGANLYFNGRDPTIGFAEAVAWPDPHAGTPGDQAQRSGVCAM
jgi:hypothetical protein